MSQHNEWPTKENDLKAASAIMMKYQELNDAQSLGLFEVAVNEGKDPDVRLSEWVIEMVDYFQEQYGAEQGEFVTRLVVGKYLTAGHTIH